MKSNPTNTEPSKFTSREASFFQSPWKMHTKLLPAFSDGPHPSAKVFGKTNYSKNSAHYFVHHCKSSSCSRYIRS
jgi:hypothetical protein